MSRGSTSRAWASRGSSISQTSEKGEESIRADFKEEAERRVKTTLLIEEIAKREKIEATPVDLEVRARRARAPVRATA